MLDITSSNKRSQRNQRNHGSLQQLAAACSLELLNSNCKPDAGLSTPVIIRMMMSLWRLLACGWKYLGGLLRRSLPCIYAYTRMLFCMHTCSAHRPTNILGRKYGFEKVACASTSSCRFHPRHLSSPASWQMTLILPVLIWESENHCAGQTNVTRRRTQATCHCTSTWRNNLGNATAGNVRPLPVCCSCIPASRFDYSKQQIYKRKDMICSICLSQIRLSISWGTIPSGAMRAEFPRPGQGHHLKRSYKSLCRHLCLRSSMRFSPSTTDTSYPSPADLVTLRCTDFAFNVERTNLETLKPWDDTKILFNMIRDDLPHDHSHCKVFGSGSEAPCQMTTRLLTWILPLAWKEYMQLWFAMKCFAEAPAMRAARPLGGSLGAALMRNAKRSNWETAQDFTNMDPTFPRPKKMRGIATKRNKCPKRTCIYTICWNTCSDARCKKWWHLKLLTMSDCQNNLQSHTATKGLNAEGEKASISLRIIGFDLITLVDMEAVSDYFGWGFSRQQVVVLQEFANTLSFSTLPLQ